MTVRVGVTFPNRWSQPSAVRDIAEAIEGLGFAHLTVFDHVVNADPSFRQMSGPYRPGDDFSEPLCLLAFISAITRRVELATGVLVLPQRQTALVAKQAAQIDALSGSRLRLGVGVGWNHVEFQALGEDFSTRGRRCDEQITALRLLWESDLVTFQGSWHDLDGVSLDPRPRRRIPLWIGGGTVPAFQRAAHLGDGVLFMRRAEESHEDSLRRQTAAMLFVRSLREADTHTDAFGFDVRLHRLDGPAVMAAQLTALQSAGATHVTINMQPGDLASPDDFIGRLVDVSQTLPLTTE